MIFLLLILNFAISWFNAWSVGRVLVESKMIGGFFRMTVWCGAIMSACAFTWVYLTLLGTLTQSFQWLSVRNIQARHPPCRGRQLRQAGRVSHQFRGHLIYMRGEDSSSPRSLSSPAHNDTRRPTP